MFQKVPQVTKLYHIMDNAVPEWTIDYQTISFQSLGIQSPLRVYHNEENPAEGTRVDLGSLHMIMFGESYQIGFEQIFLHDGTNLIRMVI